ncbi:MAG TPA: glycosyltransferase [Capillimicrobium sp.]|jgi:glycosyltransferase involved in cell wall biosynthesis
MRALVVSNMRPDSANPARGVFVRDQVAALRRLDGLEVDLVEGLPGGAGYARLGRELAGRRGYDIVHAHFGLTGWPALAVRGARRAITLHGTDVRHPRSGRLTRAVLPRYDLVAAASEQLAAELGRPGVRVLPCGVSLERFRPIPRGEARERLGLRPRQPLLLLPADPDRPVKRADRARELAAETGVRLATLGATDPDQVPLWVNAATAVLIPSDAEGFGLAALEALACDVPVLATPVGNHPAALEGVAGALCAEWDLHAWAAHLRELLDEADPRVAGRDRAARWGADAMAQRVAAAWREIA